MVWTYALAEDCVQDQGRALFEGLRLRHVDLSEVADAAVSLVGLRGGSQRKRILSAALKNPWSLPESWLHDLLDKAGLTYVANFGVRVEG